MKPEDTTPDIRNQNQTQENKTKMKSIFEEMMKPKPVKPSTSQPKLTQTQAKTKISGYLWYKWNQIEVVLRERELQQNNKLANCFTTKPENLSPSIPSVSTTLSPPSNSCPQSAPRAVSENQGGFSADLIWEKETGLNEAKRG